MNHLASSLNNWLPPSPKLVKSTRKAAVYNRYLKTVGGGERTCLEFARALEDLGYEITLITDPGSDISIQRLCSVFEIHPKSKWKLAEVPPYEVEKYCRETFQDVFVNNTFASYIASAAPIGIYLLMFPHQVTSKQLEALKSYNSIFCISPFVDIYLKIRWGNDLPVVVFPPPISEKHFSNASVATKKEKLILNIGRFNVDGHSKCQKDAIEAFIQLKNDGVLDSEWKMVVAGHLNEGERNKEYFDLCTKLAPDSVSVLKNISFEALVNLYSRATILFQFTGFGLDFGVIPERCEHLGLVAMDALCYGTIPVVFERSGAALFTDWGESIYSFTDLPELSKIVSLISKDFGKIAHKIRMRKCRSEAQKYSYANFHSKIASILAE